MRRTIDILTWNCENIKNTIYCLNDFLQYYCVQLAFLSEPNIFQSDLLPTIDQIKGGYTHFLNSDDIYDPELPMVQNRMVGGTLVLWKTCLDPYVTIHQPTTSSHTALILKLPEHQITIHVCIYLPTSGKEHDFVTELTNLHLTLVELSELYPCAAFFIRGDSNVNTKNMKRVHLLSQITEYFNLASVHISHPTYHHFTGGGQYDSNINVLLYSRDKGASEVLIDVICKKENPSMLSHHDILLSQCIIPATPKSTKDCENLIVGPRITNTRLKCIWNTEGVAKYMECIGPILSELRSTWLVPDSPASMSVLLQMTHHVLINTASVTNKSRSLATKPLMKPSKTPKVIRIAAKRLNRAHRQLRTSSCPDTAQHNYSCALKAYRRAVRTVKLHDNKIRDEKLISILTDNPAALYSFIRSTKKANTTSIDKLTVGKKVYLENKVADGFYDAMTALKTIEPEELFDQDISEQISNYEHIMHLCTDKQRLPQISLSKAENIISRLKKNVKDFYSVTALHYINAGHDGLLHFHALLNAIISDVNNASIEELNIAIGLICYKGHKKEKTSERSYRTISSCPFLAKALDLYIRDLYHVQWDAVQASTQYQGSGSSHDLASLLVTEVIQYSLHVANQPVFLLVLDAQSAFDRCLRQILVCELFRAGMQDDALVMINNRLANRSTVYEWNKELIGPAPDITGFEQGGINSSDYYKLYNNSQLDTAQRSGLGVDMGSGIVSAIGQADDVILCANSINDMRLLVTLTEKYCKKYRVKLVPSKTKLLGYCKKNQMHLLDLAKLTSQVSIDGHPVQFVTEAEHVGVLRNTAGNMTHIMNRIVEHKKGMNFAMSAGLSRGHTGNPAASLKVHQLYGTAKLFSGVASLVLTKSELSILDNHYQKTIMQLQRLHNKTPRCFVFLLAGCLPGEAVLHQKQLSMFMQICHLPQDPLHCHASHTLLCAKKSANSWFQQIYHLCLMYGLGHPLHLLQFPPSKISFKNLVKTRIVAHWEDQLKDEATKLPSLQYFMASRCSLTQPHNIWLAAASNSFEIRKATVLARMASGRFRSEYLARHWSSNKQGYCLAPTCTAVVGDLQHLLIQCPALNDVRERMWNMFLQTSVMYPALLTFLTQLDKSSPDSKLRYLLDPEAVPEVQDLWELYGQRAILHVHYMTRTYAYYLYRQKQILLGFWPSDNPAKSRKNCLRQSQGSGSKKEYEVDNHKHKINTFHVSGPTEHDINPPVPVSTNHVEDQHLPVGGLPDSVQHHLHLPDLAGAGQESDHHHAGQDSQPVESQDGLHDFQTLLCQSPAVPKNVGCNDDTALHRPVVAGCLAGPSLAPVCREDSVGTKSDKDSDSLAPIDLGSGHGGGGELLPGRVLAGIRGMGDGVVSRLTMTTFTPIVSSSAVVL